MSQKPSESQTTDENREMFALIARRYDLLNRLMSFGFDKRWRKKMARAMRAPANAKILDVAAGTADVAIAVANAYPDASVIGIDVSDEMMEIGRKKIEAAGLAERVVLKYGNACDIGFESNSFDAISCAFGIRNVKDRPKALAEMRRVLKPGGRAVILEPSFPKSGFFARLFDFHFRRIAPLIGAGLSNRKAYKYLVNSVDDFPEPDDFCEMMKRAGFSTAAFTPMTGGAAILYVGEKQ